LRYIVYQSIWGRVPNLRSAPAFFSDDLFLLRTYFLVVKFRPAIQPVKLGKAETALKMNRSDDIEKTQSPATHSIAESPSSEEIDLDKEGEREGYVLDVKNVHSSKDLKLAPDGHTVLIPQPSDDPHDPLNWTHYKKHLILFVISACSFLPDYGSATGAVTLLIQAK